jgi:hypothetical protein
VSEIPKPEQKKKPEHAPDSGDGSAGERGRKILGENTGANHQTMTSEVARMNRTASEPLTSLGLSNSDGSTVHFGKTGKAERFEDARGESWTSDDGKTFKREEQTKTLERQGDNFRLKEVSDGKKPSPTGTDHEKVSVDYLKQNPQEIFNMNLNELKATLPAFREDMQRRGYNPESRVLGFGTGPNDPDNPFVAEPSKLYRPNPQAADRIDFLRARAQAPSAEQASLGITDPFGINAKANGGFELNPAGDNSKLGKLSIDPKQSELKLQRDLEGFVLANASPEEQGQFAQRQTIEREQLLDPDQRGSLEYRLKVPEPELTASQRKVYEDQLDLQSTLVTGDQLAKRLNGLEAEYARHGWGPDSHLSGTGDPELDRQFLAEVRSKDPATVSEYENLRVLRTIDAEREENPDIFASGVDVSKLTPEQAKFRLEINTQERDTRRVFAQRMEEEVKKAETALTDLNRRHGWPAKAANAIVETVGTDGGWAGYLDRSATPAATLESLASAQATSQGLATLARDFPEGNNSKFEEQYREQKVELAKGLLSSSEHLQQLADVYRDREKGFSDAVSMAAQTLTSTALILAAPESGGTSLLGLAAVPAIAAATKVGTEVLNDRTAEIRDAENAYSLREGLQDASITALGAMTMPGGRLLEGAVTREALRKAEGAAARRLLLNEGEQALSQAARRTLLGRTVDAVAQLTPQQIARASANFGMGLARSSATGSLDGFTTGFAEGVIKGEDPLKAGVVGAISGAGGGTVGHVLGGVLKAGSKAVKDTLSKADAPHSGAHPSGEVDIPDAATHPGESPASQPTRIDGTSQPNGPHPSSTRAIEPSFAAYPRDRGTGMGVGGRVLHNIDSGDGFAGAGGPGTPRPEDLAGRGTPPAGANAERAGAPEGAGGDNTLARSAGQPLDADQILGRFEPGQLQALNTDAAKRNFVELYNNCGGEGWSKEQLQKALTVSSGPFENATDSASKAFLMQVDQAHLDALHATNNRDSVRNFLAVMAEDGAPGNFSLEPNQIAAATTMVNSRLRNLDIYDQRNIARLGLRQPDLERLANTEGPQAAANFKSLNKQLNPKNKVLDPATGEAMVTISTSKPLRQLDMYSQAQLAKLTPEQLGVAVNLNSRDEAQRFVNLCQEGQWHPANVNRAAEIFKSDMLRNLSDEQQDVLRRHSPEEIGRLAALDNPETIDKFIELRKLNINPNSSQGDVLEGFTDRALAILGSELRDLPQPHQEALLKFSPEQINKLAAADKAKPGTVEEFFDVYDQHNEKDHPSDPDYWTARNLGAWHKIATSELNQLSYADRKNLFRTLDHSELLDPVTEGPGAKTLIDLCKSDPKILSKETWCTNALELSASPVLRQLPVDDQLTLITKFRGYMENLAEMGVEGARQQAQRLR